MFKVFFSIIIYLVSNVAFAYEHQNENMDIDKVIVSRLEEFLTAEQILDKQKNIEIGITYPQQKNNDLNSLVIKNFELTDVNVKRHAFTGIIYLDDALNTQINLSGKFQILISLPVLKIKLPKGHIISEMDLEEKFFPHGIISSNYISNKQELIGMTLKKMVKANIAIKKEFITSAIIINKNDMISLEHNLGKVTLKVLVTALDSGSVGDIIRVKNAKTKQVMHAEILDNKTVKLKLN